MHNLYYPAGAIRKWDNLDDVEIVIRPSVRWTMNILALESVDENARMARTRIPATYALRKIPRETYKTVWVENVSMFAIAADVQSLTSTWMFQIITGAAQGISGSRISGNPSS